MNSWAVHMSGLREVQSEKNFMIVAWEVICIVGQERSSFNSGVWLQTKHSPTITLEAIGATLKNLAHSLGHTRLARLFLTVASSLTAQDRQLSELIWRSWRSRHSLKIETIDRDSVVSSCNTSVQRVHSFLDFISFRIEENLISYFYRYRTLRSPVLPT